MVTTLEARTKDLLRRSSLFYSLANDKIFDRSLRMWNWEEEVWRQLDEEGHSKYKWNGIEVLIPPNGYVLFAPLVTQFDSSEISKLPVDDQIKYREVVFKSGFRYPIHNKLFPLLKYKIIENYGFWLLWNGYVIYPARFSKIILPPAKVVDSIVMIKRFIKNGYEVVENANWEI